jgi:tRNA threonylcarbamoyladenosine biosynthesis protein TsaB
MKILAIETSTNACSVALLIDDVVQSSHLIAPMQQAKLILPMIEERLQHANISLNQLDALAFGCGPGSFTGVRIATSVMQGLAYASAVPLISVSSLAAVAQAAYMDLGWKKLFVAMDARISEVYAGTYQINEAGIAELVGIEAVSAPGQMTVPESTDWYGIGNGWEVYQTQLSYKPIAQDATRLPMASAVLLLAKDKFQRGEVVTPGAALPVYLRNNVAIKSRQL